MTRSVRKFGNNTDVDIATAPEDIWPVGGVYEFPTVAKSTTVLSADPADTGGGIGAQTVRVWGLDSTYTVINQDVTMAGETAVALPTNLLRVLRSRVLTAGSNQTNLGNIDIRHGATNLCRILANRGSSFLGVYTIHARSTRSRIVNWYVNVDFPANGQAEIAVQYRPLGGAWRTEDHIFLRQPGTVYIERNYLNAVDDGGIYVRAKSDIRMRVLSTTVDNINVTSGFTLSLSNQETLGEFDLG